MRVMIFGNSGSGKSTLARRMADEHGLEHLDLDVLAWVPDQVPPTRRPLDEVAAELEAFTGANENWVIEGCYADLLDLVSERATQAIFLNLSVEACQANARRRPWEPHKYATREEQDANLPMLLEWIAAYDVRTDDFSRKAHEHLFARFTGDKVEHHGNIPPTERRASAEPRRPRHHGSAADPGSGPWTSASWSSFGTHWPRTDEPGWAATSIHTRRRGPGGVMADTQRQAAEGKVLWHFTMSVDGFVAGPNHAMDWMSETSHRAGLVAEYAETTGAVLGGRDWFDAFPDISGIYGGAWQGPVFVLTHHPEDAPPAEGVTFLNCDVAEAVQISLEAASGQNVEVFSATIGQQLLERGLIDELDLHIAPVLLGDGVRLFDRPGGTSVPLELVNGEDPAAAVNVRYRPKQ